ncbi:hypothetical protein PLICRDRAFT_243254 [Plicaturopsis crispa FD-325 SS-3]|nr:hypothetical protein PLICRDRAFT_243254 [Plicaturopsis crispa FD-325 SS-3]
MATDYKTEIPILDNISKHVEKASPGEVTPTTIDPIFPYLDPTKIPTSAQPSAADRLQVKLANAALRSVAGCGTHWNGSPALVARVLAPDGWPHIWQWLQFEHDKCIVGGAYGDEGSEMAVVAITHTLVALSLSKVTRSAVLRTPGVVALLARQWLQERPPKLANQTRSFAVALENLLERLYPTPTQEVLDAAGGDAALVATTVLARLRTSLATADVEDIVVHLSLIHEFSCISCRPLHLALINHGAIPETIKVLSWSNARAMDGTPPDTISLCFNNILLGFYSANGSAWAVQALDSGLLTALLRSARWMSSQNTGDAHVEFLINFFSEVLPKYLVFRSVLRAVRKSISQVKKLGLTTAASTGPLWDAWKAFQKLAEERLALLDAWDQEGGRSVLQACSRSQCVKYDDDKMKRCSGCLGPQYCSKECQRLAWPSHKRSCKEARQMLLAGIRMPRDDLDISFIEYITKDMLYRQIPTVMKGAIDSGISISTLYVEIDHTVVPTAFHVRRACDYSSPEQKLAGEYEWQDRLLRAGQSDGELMAMRAIVPRDENYREVLISMVDVEYALLKSAAYFYDFDSVV